MIEAITTQEYCIPCPKCGKKHTFSGCYVDSMIDCECGFGYYAFAAGDFRIVMSQEEAGSEEVVRAMRRFVVSTGRCTDIPPELYDMDREMPTPNAGPSFYVREYDLEDELEHVLREYQVSAFGECLFTRELMDSICESLSAGKDIELKRKKDGIDIIELKKKRIKPADTEAHPKIAVFRQVHSTPKQVISYDPSCIVRFDGTRDTLTEICADQPKS
jgi:hypothetical protein